MKKFVFLMVLSTTLSVFCGAQVKKYDDDIYYSPTKDAKPAREVATDKTQKSDNNNIQQQPATTTTESAPAAISTGNAANVNNAGNDFKYDDYYDYAYASRLKRFHNSSMGYNYYDSYYTNTYWYDRNPSNFGVNIYVGSGWGPSYSYRPYYYYDPFYSPWYPWYDPWYGPYWSYRPYYYPYYSHNYWHGHHGGHWNDNYYPYSTNSHYGPRGGAVSSSGTTYPNRADRVNEPRFNRAGDGSNHVVAPREGTNNGSTTSPRTEPRFERPGGNKATDPNTNKLPENNNNTTTPTQPDKADRPRFGRDPGTQPQQQQEPRPNYEQQVPRQEQPRYERPHENRNSGNESPRNNSSGSNDGGSRSGGRVSRPR